jgi:RNA polymerase sigma factor (sigma-70 family)
MMTGLTPHLARTSVDDRLRSAEQHRAARQQVITRRGRRGEQRDASAAGRALDQVVAAAATGDEHAWALLRDRYAVRVRTVARLHRLAPHDVDDVAQTTWLRLLENISKLRDANAVGAWLETTARRESLALLRQRKRERPTEDAFLADQPSEPVDERRLVAAEQRTALTSSLRQLPRHQQRLLGAMLAEPAPSYAEIATSLKVPIGSIGPTRARLLARLRRDRRLALAIGEDVDSQPGELG